MELRFGLLGPLTVEHDGSRVDVGSPKQRAVLALLLLHANRPLTPEQMIEALWGEHPPESALATLQAYISNLRKVLEPERAARAPASVLQKNGGGYQATVAPDCIDVHRFERMLGEATTLLETVPAEARRRIGVALDLWRGPALADFRYEEFAQAETTRLEEQRVAAIELQMAADLALGKGKELIPELEALVAEHPLREGLWAHLMVALYRAGRQGEALRAYRQLEAALGDELGIMPSVGVRQLELAILNQDPGLMLPASRPQPPADVNRSEVGREHERARFRDALRAASEGRGSVLLFEGEAGIGKTWLLECLEREARTLGFTTAFARCVEVGGTPAFWPWIQLTRRLGAADVARAAGSYAPNLAALLPTRTFDGDGGGSPVFRIAEALAAALRTMAEDTPIVLFIDDLYSSDPDSLAVLSLLAADIESSRLVIVGSHRVRDPGSSHPLTAALGVLGRLDWVASYQLPRFTVAEVGRLLHGLSDVVVPEAIVQAIHARTEGNAFFTIELARWLHADQNLRHRAAAESAVPTSVVEVLTMRLGQLSDAALHLVRTAAVAGRTFELAVIAGADDLPLMSAVEAVEEAVAAGFVTETDRPGWYRFSHMIVVNTILRTLGAVRRAYLHAALADALERRYADDPSRWIDVAHHRKEAATVLDGDVAVEALARAGRHALSSDALVLAEELFTARHELVLAEPMTPQRTGREIAALVDLARVVTWREGYHSPRLLTISDRLWALTGLDQGADHVVFEQPVTSLDPVMCAFQLRFSYDIVTGDIAGARGVAATLRRLSHRVPDPFVLFAASIATNVVAVHTGDVALGLQAVRKGDEALQVLDPDMADHLMLPLEQQSARVTHHAFGAWTYWLAGHHDKAWSELALARRLCDRSRRVYTKAFCLAVSGMVAAMEGSLDRVAAAVAWGQSADDEGAFGLMDVWGELLSLWVAGMRSDEPAEAAERMQRMLTELEREGGRVVQTLYWGLITELELAAGRYERALDTAKTGLARAAAAGERFWYPELQRLAAVALGHLGREDRQIAAWELGVTSALEMGIAPLIERLTLRPAGSRSLAGS